MNYIKEYIFGKKQKGEKIDYSIVTFKTTQPQIKIDFFEWCNELNISILSHRNPSSF